MHSDGLGRLATAGERIRLVPKKKQHHVFNDIGYNTVLDSKIMIILKLTC